MDFTNVVLTKDGNVAIIKLNRPDAFNAFDLEMIEEIIAALESCSEDSEVRSVILTGEGKFFCSGGDLALSRQYLKESASLFRHLTKRLDRVIKEIRCLPVPVIAAINGAVGGAGLSIAAACDLRIAVPSARFRQSYTGVGLVPDGGWSLSIPLLVGFSKAAEMVFLDPVINAVQAREMGLIHEIAEDGQLMRAAMGMAQKLADGPTAAFALAKKGLNHALFGLLDRQLEFERSSLLKLEKTADYSEALDAFFEKRKPVFKGC